jgi:hypothetical protein
MNNLEKKINELNNMVVDGKIMEAFEKFYHDDVLMQENEEDPTIGKDENRKREQEFVANITEFRGAQVINVATGNNVTMVVWHYDYTHEQWGARNYTQVAVQTWKEGKIIREQFFYAA